MAHTLLVEEILSPDLALRDTAKHLFQTIDMLPENEIVIDFSNIKSISRSFAHEYVTIKPHSTKEVTESNIPANIQKMFEIVSKTSAKPKLVDLDVVKAIAIQ